MKEKKGEWSSAWFSCCPPSMPQGIQPPPSSEGKQERGSVKTHATDKGRSCQPSLRGINKLEQDGV